MSLLVEAQLPGGWQKLAVLTPSMPPGSMSNNLPDGHRDVIMFRCQGDTSVVERSAAGTDYETAERAARVVLTAGTEELATLRNGERYEMPVTTDRGASMTVRWTHVADS